MAGMWVVLALLAVAAADEAGPLRCHDARCQYIGRILSNVHQYKVDGSELWVMYRKSDEYLRLQCAGNRVLESPAMPRSDYMRSLWSLNLVNCHLPTSLEKTLTNLNLSMTFETSERRGSLTIERLPPDSLLNADLFVGFERLFSLKVFSEAAAPTRAEPNFLSPLQDLRSLWLLHVILPAGELDKPRPELYDLALAHTGIERLPEAIHSSKSLLTLQVQSAHALDAVAIPPRLVSLELVSPATTLPVDIPFSLQDLSLTRWTETHPPPLSHCGLRKLYLISPSAIILPYGWLANCSSLEDLVVQQARNLTILPLRLFGKDHANLTLVAFKKGALVSLSQRQFDGARELLTLELNGNRLRTVSKGALPSSLRKLDLSSNELDAGVMGAVSAARFTLTEVNLGSNPRLGDLCEEDGFSALQQASRLTMLLLSRTAVTRVCRDWREEMPSLQYLDLRDTRLASLAFRDIQFWQTGTVEVQLEGAPLTLLEMTRQDLKTARLTPRSAAFIRLGTSSQLTCDCRMYLARRVLESSPHVLSRISPLKCTSGKLLQEIPVEDMVCVKREECAGLPAKCECDVRPDDDPVSEKQLVRVNCSRAALTRIPQMPRTDRIYELQLSYNAITDLQPNDLHNVKGLDLRHNSISRLDEPTAKTLSTLSGMLRLANNPLECDCNAALLLHALHNRVLGTTDLGDATCSDGTPLEAAFVVGCSPSTIDNNSLIIVMFAILFAIIIALIVYLVSSRERRLFVKAVLHWMGCFCSKQSEEEFNYDAFITFSHKDERVARKMVDRLDPPYRLCLHYRDWMPGLPISDLIVASVQQSQRTIALVSRHFLASAWARVELREAHKAAMIGSDPRLILVLLEEPNTLPLDKHLEDYIDTHTCVRWGDPWFYHKLAVALPRPRRPKSVMETGPFVFCTPRVAAPSKPKEKTVSSDLVVAKSFPPVQMCLAIEPYVVPASAL